jgi:hypothetical protein
MSEFKSQKILYKSSGNDESYTPKYGVMPIIKFLKPNMIVWCPFDTIESEFVKLIQANGNKVIYSHIENGEDFYIYEPNENWDVIVSNPPFSNKRRIFERALSFNKPIALLMTCAWLNDKYSKFVFHEANRNMQLLMFDKRIHFKQNGIVVKKTTFSSAYYCSDFLPRDIVIEELHEELEK